MATVHQPVAHQSTSQEAEDERQAIATIFRSLQTRCGSVHVRLSQLPDLLPLLQQTIHMAERIEREAHWDTCPSSAV